MEEINDKKIQSDFLLTDEYVMSYTTDEGRLYRQKYKHCRFREARRRFKEYLRSELREDSLDDGVEDSLDDVDDVLLAAMGSLCVGGRKSALELLGKGGKEA
jgi:hypothetical protein